MVVIGVLALQGDVAEHARMIERCGAEAREVRTPSDLDGVDALVMPGGESTTLGKLLVRSGLDAAIRDRAQRGMPIYGTCAGMILLASHLKGSDQFRFGLMDIEVERNAYGRQVDSFEADLEGDIFGDRPFRAIFIRAPKITRVGPEVEVLARWDGAPVWVRQGRVVATSFHPELTDDPRVHQYFLGLVNGARQDQAR